MKTLADRILVRPDNAEETTASGLIIPDTAREKPNRGTVVSVGTGAIENGTHIEPCVSVGDKVVYGKYSGTEIELEGVLHIIIKESDIMAIVNG